MICYNKQKVNRIIDIFYNNTHNHILLGEEKRYDWCCVFECTKCKHEIELFILECEPDRYIEEFVRDGYTYTYRPLSDNTFYICYLGSRLIFDRIINNEISKNMLTCDEVIIKNIIE